MKPPADRSPASPRPGKELPRRAILVSSVGVAASLSSAPQRVAAQPAVATANAADVLHELELRRQESLLLHRKVDLGGLRLLLNGRVASGEAALPVARLVIVHIWAVECRPCVEEMPLLRRLLDGVRDMAQVKVALISETTDSARLQGFFTDHKLELPRAEHFLSSDDRLRSSLQNRAQPMTLLLDVLGVVRQAFLGSIKQRRPELVDAISRLSRNL